MKPFEVMYLCLEHALPSLHKQVRRRLIDSLKSTNIQHPIMLDVGGRKSPYTIGVKSWVTITDLPRKTALQSKLNLGINNQIVEHMRLRRSNISQMLLDDMTHSQLPDQSFDCVVAVEVLEHVQDDHLFIDQVYRVLKPGGVFLMTTPNGDYVMNRNIDHARHYKKSELFSLLSMRFHDVEIEYAVKESRFYEWGLKSWSIRKPLQTLLSMLGNFINSLESNSQAIKSQSIGTQHLFAYGRRPC